MNSGADLNFRKPPNVVTLWEEEPPVNTTETIAGIPDEVKAQLRQTLDDLVKGIRRPGKMKLACERMDRMREENRLLFGEQNIAEELTREVRDRP
jgi:hypothetical protein